MTGGATPELEQIIAEGAGMCGGATQEAMQNRKRCKIKPISLLSGPFAQFGVCFIERVFILQGGIPRGLICIYIILDT